MRILISGSRGFIGGSLGSFAVQRGHEVLGLGRASQAGAGWMGQYVQVDVVSSNLADIIRQFSPHVVVHAAGAASVSASFESPLDDFRAATLSCANMLESVRCSGLKPLVVFPSSAAVYGRSPDLPIREDSVLQPISPYGYHKAACELLAREYAQCFGLHTIICRLFSVFGPTQRRLLIWEIFTQANGPGDAIRLKGTGRETRDYLHVTDVASAVLRLAEQDCAKDERTLLRIINVAGGQAISVMDLARQIRDAIAPEKEIVCGGEVSTGDPQHWQADISLLRSLVPDWQRGTFSDRLTDCLAVWKHERNSV